MKKFICFIVMITVLFAWSGFSVADGVAKGDVAKEEVKEEAPLPDITKCPDGLTTLPGGCYIILDNVLGKRVFIHTRKILMQNKTVIWLAKDAESKDALEVGKVLRGKLMKLSEVGGVRMTARTVLVSIYILDNIPMLAIRQAFEVLLKK